MKALYSAAAAPVLLIGGWTVAAALQPAGYNPVHDTISALAGHAATDRWVMTAALAGLGACHLVTALLLRPAAVAGRRLLAVGGIATVLVAVFPLPRVGSSTAHGIAAGVGFVALALWPAFSRLPGRAVGVFVTVVLAGLLAWFAEQLFGGGAWIGLTERLVAGAQALWPLVAVLTVRRRRARSSTGPRRARVRRPA